MFWHKAWLGQGCLRCNLRLVFLVAFFLLSSSPSFPPLPPRPPPTNWWFCTVCWSGSRWSKFYATSNTRCLMYRNGRTRYARILSRPFEISAVCSSIQVRLLCAAEIRTGLRQSAFHLGLKMLQVWDWSAELRISFMLLETQYFYILTTS